MSTYLSIIPLSVNEIYALIKKKSGRLDKRKKAIYNILPTRDHFRVKDTNRLKVRGWKKVFHANGNEKKARVAVLTSAKIDFKTKAIKKDKEGYYIMIKGSIQEEGIILINIYAPNIGTLKYINKILTDIKREVDRNTIIVGDFNTPLTSMDRSCRQKTNKATEVLNDTIDQLNLIDIYRTLHLNTHSFQVHMEHSLG